MEKEMTLYQKMIEIRKACPQIRKEQHSDKISYKFAKIYDVWEKVTPVMNSLGVDFDISEEKPTMKDEFGNPIYWKMIETETRSGSRLMFLYETDLTIKWINTDNKDDFLEVTVHAIGWNDDPAKAKGAAHTYALKYYLFERLCIDQGEDDPDANDFSTTRAAVNKPTAVLSQAQIKRLFTIAKKAGWDADKIKAYTVKKYGKEHLETLSRAEYDALCNGLETMAGGAA